VRRARVTGTDLLSELSDRSGVPVDLFGMCSEEVGGVDVPQRELHAEMARRRVYLHTVRWTSLGLSLIEAMHLGMPVVAVGATEVPFAVPPEAGLVSCDLDRLADGLRRMAGDPEEAAVAGKAARACALERYGLDRFLADWDAVLTEVTR
jgi:glycosyltransferase involved in cell wall biosynthesis